MQTDRQTDSGPSRPPGAAQRSAGWWARRVTGAALVAVLAAPGAAYASGPASHMPKSQPVTSRTVHRATEHAVTRRTTRTTQDATSSQAVAADMVAGATEFAGTRPVCRTVIAGAKYSCTISGGAPYYNLPSLTHAQQTKLTLAPPGSAPGYHPAAAKAYQEQLLESWGWTPAQAREYASGSFPDIFQGDFRGVNEPTVNAVSNRINGACEAADSTGSVWDCYLGQAPVRAHQISPRLLGKKVSGPLSR